MSIEAGDIVRHCRSGQRMHVDKVEGRVARCSWVRSDDGRLVQREYLISFLVPFKEALA